jgi:Flp pilus assembly protein TadD
MSTPESRATSLVREGFAAQQRGDLVAAEHAYRQALALNADEPDALQLLGALARKRGDLAQAEPLLRRSLALRPRQPHVWNTLGNLLLAAARHADAQAAYAQAIEQLPSHPDAHYNLARALHAAGRLPEAAESLNRALALAPQPTVAMLHLHAQIEGDVGLVDSALATLDKALAVAPDHTGLLHTKAVLLQRRQRSAQALALLERAQALGLDAADAHYNRGNALQGVGRHDEARAAYRAALQRQGGHPLALYDLARLRFRQGDADWDAELRAAVAADPRADLPAGTLAHLLWRAERWADAAEAWAEALRRNPQAPGLHDGQGRALVRLGRIDEGLAAHARATALAPQDAELAANHAASLLVAGRPDAALAEAERACALAPAHQYAQALRGLAWRLLGDGREHWLEDFERFVGVYDLPPPPGFADMADFNAALAEELAALHGDRRHPVDQTLRGGTQTVGDIFEQQHPLVDALKKRIAEAVTEHVASLPRDTWHPFLGRGDAARERGWRFTDSWSSRLSRQGFHTDHVHPHGWLSSAYYVQVPPGVADPARGEGWIRFGQPDLPLPGIAPGALVRRTEVPRPGRLVLFPSMMWHGTTPFHDDAVRMTIAFDVVPR